MSRSDPARKIAHQKKMAGKNRRREEAYYFRGNAVYDDRANSSPIYRKGIWPRRKVAAPGRMG
jgi:hypothetical protein